MKKALFLVAFLFSLQVFLPRCESLGDLTENDNRFPSAGSGLRMLQPVYVRLQALQGGSVVLWQAVPQNFSDYVGTVDVSDLAILVSSNAQTINLSRDGMGNVWLAINYTFAKGEYISSLMWVSTETLNENLTTPSFVSFPESYPPDVVPFTNSGAKIPVENEEIEEIANNSKTQNMIETVRNVLNFVNETQEYDRPKVELLLSGNLNTANIMDFLEDSLEVMETNSSICFERSLYTAAILRAAGVPTRTFTDIRLRTWIQVWLPQPIYGWVDAEAECNEERDKARVLFPRALSVYAPWVIENSSDATFPFIWVPETRMRVANLTFIDVKAFNIDEYRTVLSQPVDKELFDANPELLSFPVLFLESDIVSAAVTREGSDLALSIVKTRAHKVEEKVSKTFTLNETNSVSLGDLTISFEPIRQDDFLILRNFAVQGAWKLDLRILIIPIIGVPVVLTFWFYWKRQIIKRNVKKTPSASL